MTEPVIETVQGVRLSEILPQSATCPFVFHDEKDRVWVGKAISDRAPESHVASEILCGWLADYLGLPWPRAALVRLTTRLRSDLRVGGLDVRADVCVATEFERDLQDLEPPPECRDSEDNRRFMERLFRRPHCIDAFYTKGVFDIWVGMEDGKYSTLKIAPDESPVFLDGDATWITHAFEIGVKARELLPIAIDLDTNRAVFLQGVVTEPERFTPALDRVEAFEDEALGRLLEALPPELEPEQDTRLMIQERLVGKWRSRMVDELRRKIGS